MIAHGRDEFFSGFLKTVRDSAGLVGYGEEKSPGERSCVSLQSDNEMPQTSGGDIDERAEVGRCGAVL